MDAAMKPKCLLLYVLGLSFVACQKPARRADLSPLVANHKASVFIFLAPDCPLSQNYTLTLNNLHAQFRNDAAFYGVVAGDGFKQSEIDGFVKTYKVSFPVLHDRDFRLTDFFGAVKTPEVFVVNRQAETLYKGAIDNWAADLGEYRTIITSNYLRDVLNGFLRDNDVPLKETHAVGCFIERRG